MNNKLIANGGKRKGSGRKPLDPDLRTVLISVKLTEKQKATFQAIDGPKWLRHQLDRIGQDH